MTPPVAQRVAVCGGNSVRSPTCVLGVCSTEMVCRIIQQVNINIIFSKYYLTIYTRYSYSERRISLINTHGTTHFASQS